MVCHYLYKVFANRQVCLTSLSGICILDSMNMSQLFLVRNSTGVLVFNFTNYVYSVGRLRPAGARYVQALS